MMLIEETAVAAEVLPVAALRSHLRLGSGFSGSEDAAETAALQGFLRAAIAMIEGRTGKVLLKRRFLMRLEDWRDRMGQSLPLAPVHSIERIAIEDAAGLESVLPADSWRLVPDGQRPVILPAGVVLPHVPRRGSVTVRFTAGFGETWAEVPPDLAQAVIMLAARHYEDRHDAHARQALPFGVSALIERWRAVRTLAGRGNRELR